ncbi:MAG: hypothetical protein OXT74_05990 [Candidatus Poribacteria bacterium]|nr:hypothetical protein [Candidatus Poribacteria bacterium]
MGLEINGKEMREMEGWKISRGLWSVLSGQQKRQWVERLEGT